ncbi:MAG: alpha/beta hydrolase [Bacteroidales bacterium]|nr:alpha/beta hydrolase [Bacteroidales bacterium]MCF8390706.1 alpha/beta hydrolase [Bacteroidales bacterium]
MNIKALTISLTVVFFLFFQGKAQISTEENELYNGEIKLGSTLLIPENIKKPPVVLIIAGSGPTDKNGNNSFMLNNHLKYLAEGLAAQGIASLRYDKRFIPGNNHINEADIRFEDIIEDANFCFQYLKTDKRFGNKYILGHSQGSLVGMEVAKNNKLKGFISVAGPSEAIGTTIIRQLRAQNEELADQAAILIDSMLAGFEVKYINPYLLSLFRPSVQPFLREYMSYNPSNEISLLKTRILIVQGTTDIQVEVKDAEKLHEAAPKSELLIIEGMNHILKEVPLERSINIASYNNPDLIIDQQLIKSLREFIK